MDQRLWKLFWVKDLPRPSKMIPYLWMSTLQSWLFHPILYCCLTWYHHMNTLSVHTSLRDKVPMIKWLCSKHYFNQHNHSSFLGSRCRYSHVRYGKINKGGKLAKVIHLLCKRTRALNNFYLVPQQTYFMISCFTKSRMIRIKQNKPKQKYNMEPDHKSA